jgi:hypothetical protein
MIMTSKSVYNERLTWDIFLKHNEYKDKINFLVIKNMVILTQQFYDCIKVLINSDTNAIV